jgi:hypothetical protein
MYQTQAFWPPSPQSLEQLLTLELANSLSRGDDPIASDPAQLMVAAGMTPDLWQARLLQSDWQRALLLCSRQAGKSTVTATLATYMAQYHAGSLTLLLSASQRQSGELFKTVKNFYHALPNAVPVKQESALQLHLVNDSRVIALPGKEATIRGYAGVDLLVIDEAARVADALYFSVRPMLAVSGGRLICLSTPFGKRGFFHQEWTQGSDDWHRTKITAHDVPRITPEFLAEERRTLGEWWFRQEYLVEFMETTDQVFSHDDVMAAFDDEVKPLFGAETWANLWSA